MFEHFIDAQRDAYETVIGELAGGRKRSHWMWFIFPQLRALGRSPMAHRFGLADLDDAKAYAAHPVLGRRLRDCVAQVLLIDDGTAVEIFGSPDDLKFRSCLTLFFRATGEPLFRRGLDRFYGGEEDPLTLRAIGLS